MDENLLKGQIGNAPEEVKKLLANRVWSQAVDEIVQKNSFSPEQKIALENEVLFVLLGMELISNFSQNIQNNLNLREFIVKDIAQEIYEKIFKQVEEFLPTEEELETEPSQKEEPIIITRETKEEAVKELARRTAEKEKLEPKVPEIAPDIRPMIEPEEKVHEVKPQAVDSGLKIQDSGIKSEEKPKLVQTPNYSYPKGKDPYHEPIE